MLRCLLPQFSPKVLPPAPIDCFGTFDTVAREKPSSHPAEGFVPYWMLVAFLLFCPRWGIPGVALVLAILAMAAIQLFLWIKRLFGGRGRAQAPPAAPPATGERSHTEGRGFAIPVDGGRQPRAQLKTAGDKAGAAVGTASTNGVASGRPGARHAAAAAVTTATDAGVSGVVPASVPA